MRDLDTGIITPGEDAFCQDCGSRFPDHLTSCPASARAADGPGGYQVGGVIPAPGDPMGVARAFVGDRYTGGGRILLRHYRGSFHVYDGRCWPEAEERRVRAEVWAFLEEAEYIDPESHKPKPFNPTRHKVANVMEALAAVGHVDGHAEPPMWLEGGHGHSARELVVMENGLFHLPTRDLVPHTPDLFTLHALAFGYDPQAPPPKRCFRFLDELWGDDQEAKDTLAEIMGYILSGDTRQQKIFLLVGPLRSGKGTIGRVLRGLLGDHNVAAPTMSSMVTNFGLSPLIGKPLALVSDARLSTRADSSVAVERLLSISGEDSLTIDRKYRDPWTGQLPSRFLILTNELPRLVDSSGALAGRFVVLTTTRSFFGKEDPTLTDKLLEEIPGIFNWALEGLDRLRDRGHFVQPDSSTANIELMADLTSPIGAFLRQRCVVGPYQVDKDRLFGEWKDWATEEGLTKPGTKNVFFRNLRAAVPAIKIRRPREGDDRRHVVEGVGLQSETSLTDPDHESGQDSGQGSDPPQDHRSERVVRVGQGSSPLYAEPEGGQGSTQEGQGSPEDAIRLPDRQLGARVEVPRATRKDLQRAEELWGDKTALLLGVKRNLGRVPRSLDELTAAEVRTMIELRENGGR
jgi:putative DNA primase/helicase